MTDRAFEAENAEATAALADLAATLTTDELTMDLGGGWSVAMAFGHLAFWDAWHAARWRFAAEHGETCPPPAPGVVTNRNNDALEATWRALPADAAVALCLDAAAAMDILAASLTDAQVDAARAAGGPNWIERSPHRQDHIAQIRRALGRA